MLRNRMVVRRPSRAVVVALACGVFAVAARGAQAPPDARARLLGTPQRIADGVTLYRLDPSTVADLPGPLAVQALALDPRAVDLTTALALGTRQGRGPVADAARREGAVAAVNAGFFALASGDPTGALRIDGVTVSDARLLRGAVAIASDRGTLRLTFDRARVRLALVARAGGGATTAPVDGVDTVRRAGGVTIYTRRFGPDTGTPGVGVEWPVTLGRPTPGRQRAGSATRTTPGTIDRRIDGGRTEIPPRGTVLSFGGATPPAPLDRLRAGVPVVLEETWETETPSAAAAFARADDVIGGAGLLVKAGRPMAAWTIEQTSESLRTGRHPRTLLGVDVGAMIWLVTVDGRQPGYSVGLTFPELQRLALGLALTDVLNLDGGGSTTMVVGGEVVNRPSDPLGPRPVSDVLLVRPRPAPPPAARR